MNKKRLVLPLSILNLLGFLGTVVVNGLAVALPINNKTTAYLSELYPNLFTPAGLTFSIWGLIYVLLAIFAIYQLIPSVRRDAQKVDFVQKIGPLFFISSLANIGWIFAWHYEMVSLSLVLMLILFGSLLAIYLRLNIGKSEAPKTEKYLVHLPFSVYLGWITIATIANATALLVNINWNAWGLGEQFWAVVVIIVGIAIALSVLFTRKDIFYCLVVDWALLGILIKRLSVTTVPDQRVVVATIVGLVLVSGGVIAQLIRKKVY
ncbi:MAG: tryptophan-rich sensory protein [Dehalococcoidia bacterium]|nr:MAG: tryptophan-rich sensory protein [Dehalococcoidia bacterium]